MPNISSHASSNKVFIYLLSSAFISLLAIILLLKTDNSYATENIVTVYKSPTCGCCKKWISHLEDNGFRVKTINSAELSRIKDENNVPANARSCHTATINNYVIEGHVPAADIKKLLAEKRAVTGLAVPGMPMGSPGMEGSRRDHYSVYEFSQNGSMTAIKQY